MNQQGTDQNEKYVTHKSERSFCLELHKELVQLIVTKSKNPIKKVKLSNRYFTKGDV